MNKFSTLTLLLTVNLCHCFCQITSENYDVECYERSEFGGKNKEEIKKECETMYFIRGFIMKEYSENSSLCDYLTVEMNGLKKETFSENEAREIFDVVKRTDYVHLSANQKDLIDQVYCQTMEDIAGSAIYDFDKQAIECQRALDMIRGIKKIPAGDKQDQVRRRFLREIKAIMSLPMKPSFLKQIEFTIKEEDLVNWCFLNVEMYDK